MKKWFIPTAAVLTGFFLTACQDTVNTLENQDKQAVPATIEDSRFVTDSFLKRRLKLSAVRTATTPSGHMSVEVSALNERTGFFSEAWSSFTGKNPYPVEYKFVWQDENGMVVNSHNSGIWNRITIRPGETVYFRAVAPQKNCKDFVLSVQEAH